MSLSEETLSAKTDMPFTSCSSAIKSLDQIRKELAEQTESYFSKGGKINTGTPSKPVNDTTNVEADMAKRRKRSHTAVASKMFVTTPITFHDGKNRANDRASSGHQNISSMMRNGGMRHIVIIGKTAYGTFSDIKDAIAKRDSTREILGMEPAFY